MAKQEFEAWLITDGDAVRAVLEKNHDRNPEKLEPGQAKDLLNQWIDERNYRGVYFEIANQCDLDELKTGSRSFETFFREIRQHFI